MNQLKTMGLFGLIAVISVVGMNAVLASNFGIADTPQTKTNEKTSFLGHVEATVTDPKGNIIAYRQSDNVVTNVGHNCIAQMVFGVTFGTGSQPCGASALTPKYIGVTNTAITPAAADTSLTGEITTNGLTRAAGTVTAFQVASAGTTSTIGQVQNVFTATATQSAQAAGLFDAVSAGNMFADNTFTAVTLNNGDQLTVTWKITLS